MAAFSSTSQGGLLRQRRFCFLVIFVLLLVVGLWYWLGFKPPIGDAGEQPNDPLHQRRGTFGDQFGAVNALFSGLAFAAVIGALYLQRRDLVEASRQHADTLRTQVLLQLMDEIRSREWGNAHYILAQRKGWRDSEIAREFKMEREHRPLTGELNQCRRSFVRPFFKVWHLHCAGVVSPALARQIITPNMAKTALGIVKLYFELIAKEIDPGQELAESEREFFNFVDGLYNKRTRVTPGSRLEQWQQFFKHHIPDP